MLTPKEVEERRFPLVRIRQGYDIGAVDGFLDELTADYITLYEENATIKAKMKILIQHITDQSRRIRDLEAEAEGKPAPFHLSVLPDLPDQEESQEPVGV